MPGVALSHRTGLPATEQRPAISCARRVRPAPAGPLSQIPPAAARAASAAASSRSRPTSGQSLPNTR